MFVKIYTLLILLAKFTLEDGNRRNNIEKHFSGSGPNKHNPHNRVQNNFLVHNKHHHRPSSQSSNSATDRPEVKLPKPSNCSLETKEGKTFLWRIDTHPPSYFFGTIHVPYTRVWTDISNNAKKAFKASDQVYFELDLTNPYTIASLTSCQLLPRGLNLSQVLPPNIYHRLRSHLDWVRQQMQSWITEDQAGRGLYADYLYNAITGNWERKRPVWAMLMVNGLTASDIASRGFPVLDLYLAQLAEKQNKKVGAVERVEEQCLPLNGLTYGQVIFALNQTLQQHEDIRSGLVEPSYTTDDLIRNYQCGNLNSVVFNQDTAQVPLLTARRQLNTAELKLASEIDSYFRESLIYKRNRRMAGRVIELLLNNPGSSFFFAFGAGHFVGDNTIIDVVRKAGFVVEPVTDSDDLVDWSSDSSKDVTNEFVKQRGKSVGGGTVKGTFEDLSDDERTKAFLQLLEYKLRLEKEQRLGKHEMEKKDNKFQELWEKLPSHQVNPVSETEEEKAVRESIQVWYGINCSVAHSGSGLGYSIIFSLIGYFNFQIKYINL